MWEEEKERETGKTEAQEADTKRQPNKTKPHPRN